MLLVNDRPTPDGGAISVATDVTSLKAAERASAERAAAMDAASDGIAITSEDGTFVYMNPSHARIFGYDRPADLVGRHWSVLYRPAERRVIETDAMASIAATGTWRGEVLGKRRDGSSFSQEVSLTLRPGVGLICVTRDVTARKQAEAERAQLMAGLAEAQRREAVGQLAAGFAHDFNNVLSAIAGSARLAANAVEAPSTAIPHLDRIEQAVGQASEMVSRLLALGRREPVTGTTDVCRVAVETVAMARTILPPGIALSAELPPSAEAVADPTELSQILLNLVINARDAMPEEGGSIRVTVHEAAWDWPDPAAGHAACVRIGKRRADRAYVRMTVEDTGSGMDETVLARAFEPFYTTKGRGGSGLGLAVTASLVKAAGGSLVAASTPGRGTLFKIALPCAAADTARTARPHPAAPADMPDLSGRLVLAVDDDPAVLAIVAGLLEAAGAEVATSDDPRDALEILADHPESFDLVVTDLEMPGLDGDGFAAAIQALRKDLPVIICSGRPSAEAAVGDAVAAVIGKPVDPAALAAALRAAGLGST